MPTDTKGKPMTERAYTQADIDAAVAAALEEARKACLAKAEANKHDNGQYLNAAYAIRNIRPDAARILRDRDMEMRDLREGLRFYEEKDEFGEIKTFCGFPIREAMDILEAHRISGSDRDARVYAEALEAAARYHECGCSRRHDVKEAKTKSERWRICPTDNCPAIESEEIRALPNPYRGEKSDG